MGPVGCLEHASRVTFSSHETIIATVSSGQLHPPFGGEFAILCLLPPHI